MSENKILQKALSYDYDSKYQVREMIREYREETDGFKKSELMEKIFYNNIRHIKKISLKFSKMYQDPDDCFQNATLGFFDALERFDLNQPNAFTTYLYSWAVKYIFDGCQRSIISVPRNVQFMNYSYKKYKEIMESESADNHTEFLANKLFQSDSFKRKYLENGEVNTEIQILSLDNNRTGKDGDSESKLRLVNIIRDNQKNPEQIVINKINLEQLRKIIDEKLNKRERDIIILRYFSDTEKLTTLKEIVEILGTSQERIRQIEEKALWKLKRNFIQMNRDGCF